MISLSLPSPLDETSMTAFNKQSTAAWKNRLLKSWEDGIAKHGNSMPLCNNRTLVYNDGPATTGLVTKKLWTGTTILAFSPRMFQKKR